MSYTTSFRNHLSKRGITITSRDLEDLFNLKLDPHGKMNGLLKNVKPDKKEEERDDRTDERLANILSFLKGRPVKNVLDIGAGDASILKVVKDKFNLLQKDVFALDAKTPTDIPGITTITYDKDGNIPLRDNEIDLIICFNVLHHVPRLNPLLSEIARVLSPKGILIIREHDDNGDPIFKRYIELIHIYHYLVNKEDEDPLLLLTRKKLGSLMNGIGLVSVNYTTYENVNPQRIYHEAFVKEIDAGTSEGERKREFATGAERYLFTYLSQLDRVEKTRKNLGWFPYQVIPKLLEKYDEEAFNENRERVWAACIEELRRSILDSIDRDMIESTDIEKSINRLKQK